MISFLSFGGLRLQRTRCRSSDTHQSRQRTARAMRRSSMVRDREGESRRTSTAVAIRLRTVAYTMTLPIPWPDRLLRRPKRTLDCNHLSIRIPDAGLPEASPKRIHPIDRGELKSQTSCFSSCTLRRQRPDQHACGEARSIRREQKEDQSRALLRSVRIKSVVEGQVTRSVSTIGVCLTSNYAACLYCGEIANPATTAQDKNCARPAL